MQPKITTPTKRKLFDRTDEHGGKFTLKFCQGTPKNLQKVFGGKASIISTTPLEPLREGQLRGICQGIAIDWFVHDVLYPEYPYDEDSIRQNSINILANQIYSRDHHRSCQRFLTELGFAKKEIDDNPPSIAPSWHEQDGI